MTDERAYYERIAQAEQAITDAGFQRDISRAVWVSPASGKTAKVVREANGKFYVAWS